jgi:hypothetical protein
LEKAGRNHLDGSGAAHIQGRISHMTVQCLLSIAVWPKCAWNEARMVTDRAATLQACAFVHLGWRGFFDARTFRDLYSMQFSNQDKLA